MRDAASSSCNRYGVALLLMAAYTLNCADRTLIAIIGQPLKIDLQLSDTQLGALVGAAFAALYAISGIPIARLAERFNRVNILFVVMTVWSGLTALCGVATSFVQLLLLRMGVGFGEAGCSPPAHSLLSDYFEPRRRATALSIYSCGISLGYILSAALGGYIAAHFGWRMACVALGVPGVAIAAIIKLSVREPRVGSPQPVRKFGLRGDLRELVGVAASLALRWPMANFVLGLTVASFASQGAWAFVPAFFNRVFELDYATIGVVAALTGGVPVGLGLLAGGYVADLLGARSARWYALVPAIGLVIATPLYVSAFVQSEWKLTALLLGLGGFFQYISFGPTLGVIQNVVTERRRATATAFVYVILNVVALGGGALFTGWLIDRFADFNLIHPSRAAFPSFAAVFGSPLLSPQASFRAVCPGGQAAAATGQAAHALCRATLAQSSRQGILLTVLLYAWAAAHYVLGAFGLGREMQSVRSH